MQTPAAYNLLLNEVFMTPANKTANPSFATAAACSGRCQSGHCMGAVIEDASFNSPEFYAQ